MRDMTEQQFRDALKRNNMRPTGFLGYVEFGIADGTISGTRVSICKFNAGMNRRAQLAYLLERKDYHETHDINGNPRKQLVEND